MRHAIRDFTAASSAIFLLFCQSGRAAPPQYTVTDLGIVGEALSLGFGINASGQVAGFSATDTHGPVHAVRWTGTIPSFLGTLGGSSCAAYGINASGQVAGYSYIVNDYGDYHAVRWTGTTPTDLGTLGGHVSQAIAINASGQVAGSSYDASDARYAVRWTGAIPTSLRGLGGTQSAGVGINDSGQVVGVSWDAAGTAYAVRWTGTTPTRLGTLGGDSYAYAINASGNAVGSSMTPDGIWHAVRWTDTTPTDLGTLGGSSYAIAINARGDVVGRSFGDHTFLYTGGAMYDLQSLLAPGSAVTEISVGDSLGGGCINDSGQIAATGLINGETHAIRLTPVVTPVVFIPGIAGSVLTGNGETGANGNGEYLWPTVGAQDIRALNVNNNTPDVQAVGIVREYAPSDNFPVGPLKPKIVYGPLLDYLVTRMRLSEFDLEEHPERMTNGFMQQNWPEKPTLFPFPYDWRQSNASHVNTLHSYIAQIKQLHGVDKVDVIAHSMGGLLLRQYVLTPGYAADVNRVVTIGTPVWGAPKSVYRMLTGKFYDGPADWDTSTDMKAALRSMPSTAELIPPFEVGHISGRETLLSEDRWDLNNEGSANEVYSPSTFWKFIDGIAPGFHSANTALHTAAQDSWDLTIQTYRISKYPDQLEKTDSQQQRQMWWPLRKHGVYWVLRFAACMDIAKSRASATMSCLWKVPIVRVNIWRRIQKSPLFPLIMMTQRQTQPSILN